MLAIKAFRIKMHHSVFVFVTFVTLYKCNRVTFVYLWDYQMLTPYFDNC